MFLEAPFLFFLVFSLIGWLIFYIFYDSIVIKRRRPILVIFESIAVILTGLLESNISDGMNCYLFHLLISTTGIVAIMIIMARISFVYAYLSSEVENIKALRVISNIFWDGGRIKKAKFALALIAIILLSDMFVLGFHTIANTFAVIKETASASCNVNVLRFIHAVEILSSILLFTFTVRLIKQKIFDQILLSLELILFMVGSVIFVGFNLFIAEALIYQCIFYIFMELYFPVIAHYRHIRVLRKKVNTSSSFDLSNPNLEKVCKQFYCEENLMFLLYCKKYREKQITHDQLVALFFQSGSEFELNVDYTLKKEFLESEQSKRYINLSRIEIEIATVLKLNVIPYL